MVSTPNVFWKILRRFPESSQSLLKFWGAFDNTSLLVISSSLRLWHHFSLNFGRNWEHVWWCVCKCETRLPMVSALESWSNRTNSNLSPARSLRCVLGQDTLISQCPFPPRCIKGGGGGGGGLGNTLRWPSKPSLGKYKRSHLTLRNPG